MCRISDIPQAKQESRVKNVISKSLRHQIPRLAIMKVHPSLMQIGPAILKIIGCHTQDFFQDLPVLNPALARVAHLDNYSKMSSVVVSIHKACVCV